MGYLAGRQMCRVATEAKHFVFQLVVSSTKIKKGEKTEMASDATAQISKVFGMLLR